MCILIKVRKSLRGFSSVGRAPALQAGCQRFESANLHTKSRLSADISNQKWYRSGISEAIERYRDSIRLRWGKSWGSDRH